MLCNCPHDAAISDITVSTCPENFGQVQKVLFQRRYASDGNLNEISANPDKLATWTALMSAANSTKVVISPYVEAPTVEPGAVKEFGSGNEVVGGIPIVIGSEPTTFSAMIRQSAQKAIAQMKEYMCEDVGVFLVNEHGQIGCIVDDLDSITAYMPIPSKSLFVGDKKLGGFDEPDSNVLSWRFLPNWSDKFYVITPDDFNPLTDLANSAS